MPRTKLTTKSVERWPAGKARKEIPDALSPGLYLVVQPSGAKSWAIRGRADGKNYKLTIGRWPGMQLADARAAARDHALKLEKGAASHVEGGPAAEAAELARSLERVMRGIIMPSLGDDALAGLEQTEPVDMFAMMQQRALERRHASRADPWESQGREMLGSTAKVAELERQLEEAKAQLAQEDGERFRVLWREISDHEKARVLDGLTDRRERALFGLKALEKPKRLAAGRAGGGGLTCDKCGKSGLTKHDLALHTIRLHKASA